MDTLCHYGQKQLYKDLRNQLTGLNMCNTFDTVNRINENNGENVGKG